MSDKPVKPARGIVFNNPLESIRIAEKGFGKRHAVRKSA